MIGAPRYSLTDRELYDAARSGDSASLGAMLLRYRPRLHAIALHYLGAGAEADDAVSETLLIALTKLPDLRDSNLLGPWLAAVTRNYCLMTVRRRRITPLPDSELCRKMDETISDSSLESSLEQSACGEWVWNAIEGLSEKLRVTLLLRHFSAHASYEEIAAVLGVPAGTVRSRLAEARSLLAREILAQGERVPDAKRQRAVERANYLAEYVHHLYRTGDRRPFHRIYQAGLEVTTNGNVRANGHAYWINEVNEDFRHGSRFSPTRALGSQGITILEGENLNSDQYPDRCPPATVVVHFHQPEQVSVRKLCLYLGNRPQPVRAD